MCDATTIEAPVNKKSPVKWEGEEMGTGTKEEEAEAKEANGEQRGKN